MKLVADINIPYLKGVLEPFFDEVLYLPGSKISREIVKDADALLVRTRTNCNAELLEGSKVKFIGSATIGYDHIDTNYCNTKGIVWATAPGCNSGGVLQWVVCALLQISQAKNISLKGKTLGVVGVGNVGNKIAKAGEALGMNVLCCDPPRKRNENLSEFVDFATITQRSDIITFHVPLNHSGADATYHLANDKFFEVIKPNVIIINSSRGEVVETSSLVKSIKSGKVIASALDVWEGEPKVSSEIVKYIDIATPHIAGYSLEGKVNGTKMVVDALSKYFGFGLEPWCPTPDPTSTNIVLNSFVDLESAVAKTYSITNDDTVFRNNPGDFEKIRNEYSFRREFSAYELPSIRFTKGLENLGFMTNNQ
ncbi:MAG: 4-phosphoerythronate dehydrogenase [Bacteroidales bacterium]|nr:4-phosphoerythronate dehydrogenase [Bacteroidales bacterium]